MKYILSAKGILPTLTAVTFPGKYTRASRRFKTEYGSYNIGDGNRVINIFFHTTVTFENQFKPVNHDISLTAFVVRRYSVFRTVKDL
jgi:hypothetical protein